MYYSRYFVYLHKKQIQNPTSRLNAISEIPGTQLFRYK